VNSNPQPSIAAFVLALALASGAAVPGVARAQATGTTAGAILEIPATARALGLGGAYTAVVGDEGSVFANPAGLAPIRHVALGMSYQRYLFDSYLASAAAALRVGKFDVGVGFNVLDFGQDTVVRPDPSFGGERGIPDPGGAMVSAYNAVAVGAVAYRFGMLSLGANVKYLKEHISIPDTTLYDASGVGFDVGGAAALFDIAALGVVVQNLGHDLRTNTGTRAPLPRSVRVGFALNIMDPQGTPRLLVVTDWVSTRGSSAYWIFGVEGGVVSGGVGLLGRAGIATGRAPSDRRALAFGAGLVFHSVQLDYGYQGFDALGGPTHRFGLRWLP
jgi:hypothetical protein